jgi:hypothetical protein
MVAIFLVYELAVVALALSAPRIHEVLDGNQAQMGLPSGFTGFHTLIAIVFVIVATLMFLAPFTWIGLNRRR